jgi:hypothetical protein
MADFGPSFPEKSYVGNKKDGIKTGHPAINLMSHESNELSIHCLEHGQCESFYDDRKALNIESAVGSYKKKEQRIPTIFH